MERKRKLSGSILTMMAAGLTAAGCLQSSGPEMEIRREVSIGFERGGYVTRTALPDEERINDINLIVTSGDEIEDIIWTRTPYDNQSHFITLNLIRGRSYSFHTFVNFGKKIEVSSADELDEVSFRIENPDGYTGGIPMTAVSEDVMIGDAGDITLNLERLMAKISLKIDRSRLSDDVKINVTGVRIGNCPGYAYALKANKVISSYDCLDQGFTLNSDQCQALNRIGQGGISDEASLYMLENMQGDFPSEIEEDEEKVFDAGDPMASVCSFVELTMNYTSDSHFSRNGLIYRFYLGDGLENLDVERNCHYHITVTPEDDGLSGSGWRVDKTGIGTYVREIKLSSYSIDMTYKGETAVIEAEVLPADASDKSISWYSSNSSVAKVDTDGKVTATGEGRCTITCKADDRSGARAESEINVKFAPPYFMMYPGEYIEGNVGEKIHIWCEFFPPNAPFDPGLEELNYDKGRGIYDYELDEDGHGVTLTLKNPGTGIVYMTAGEPVNESGMAVVVVNRQRR